MRRHSVLRVVSLAARLPQIKRLSWLAFFLLAGCGTAPTQPPSPAAPAVEPEVDTAYASVAGTRYRIDPGNAAVTIKVFRDGPLKALGHNHIVTTQAVNGMVLIADELAQSRADVWTAIESFVIDDEAERKRAGAGFESVPTAEDIAGTRRNMFSTEALDAIAHPLARVSLEFIGVDAEVVRLTATVALAGGSTTLPINARFSRGDDVLTIDTEFDLDQRDLGITPFSVMGGALRVAPVVEVTFHARAMRVPSTTAATPARAPPRSS